MNSKIIILIIGVVIMSCSEVGVEPDAIRKYDNEIPEAPFIPDTVERVVFTAYEYFNLGSDAELKLGFHPFSDLGYYNVTLDTASNKLILDSDSIVINTYSYEFYTNLFNSAVTKVNFSFDNFNLLIPSYSFNEIGLNMEITVTDDNLNETVYTNEDLDLIAIHYPTPTRDELNINYKVRILDPFSTVKDLEISLNLLFDEENIKFID